MAPNVTGGMRMRKSRMGLVNDLKSPPISLNSVSSMPNILPENATSSNISKRKLKGKTPLMQPSIRNDGESEVSVETEEGHAHYDPGKFSLM